MPEDNLPAVWPEELNNRICMDYVGDTYAAFLNGADEFPEADRALEDRFGTCLPYFVSNSAY